MPTTATAIKNGTIMMEKVKNLQSQSTRMPVRWVYESNELDPWG